MNGTLGVLNGLWKTSYTITWSLISQSISQNTSTIRLTATLYTGNTTTISAYNSNFVLDGTTVYSGYYEKSGAGNIFVKTKDITIKHNNDGTFPATTISFGASDGYIFNPGQSGSGIIAYRAVADIPRATTSPNIDGYIERDIPFVVTPASTSFKHRLYYEYNGITGYYPNETDFFATNGYISLDESFYEKTPKSTGTGTITLYTYDSNGNLIGSKQSTLTVRCDKEDCKPIIEFDVIDINPITSQLTAGANTSDIIVKGYSNAQITYEIETRNSATLKNKTVNNTPLGDSPFVINNVDTSEFSIVAIDSRDFDTTETKPYEIVDYIPLAVALNAYRPTPTGSEIKVNFSGNYFNDTFGVVENELELSWKYRELRTTNWINGGTLVEGTDYTITEDNKFYSGTGSNVSDISLSTELFPYDKAYEIAIFYKDKIIGVDGTLYTSKPVPQGKPVFNWEEDLFNVNGKLTINEKNILELFYPVGSLYISINPTNPETLFGGSWEQIEDDAYLKIVTGNAGELDGTSSEHKIPVSSMPTHNHGGVRRASVGTSGAQSQGTSSGSGDTNYYTDYTGGGQPYYPYYYGVYVWVRIY